MITTAIFQSTCPLRGTTIVKRWGRAPATISIHVPLAGHDVVIDALNFVRHISIHVPLAGHDDQRQAILARREPFQSTCPLRGTTFLRRV